MNNDTLKRRNRGLILKLIATGRGASRVELAKATGLSKMSVSNVISEFIERDVVEESCTLSVQGQGRNPISLRISSKAPKLIGLHIFRDRCVATLCDLQLQILREYGADIHAGNAHRVMDVLCEAVEQVFPGPGESVLGIGVGSIGPVDLRRGVILNPPMFFGIHELEITATLKERFGRPVLLDSQYNCAAMAERYFGIGRQYRDFLFVGIANGIGSGVISDGGVLRSIDGFTSELGHTSIDWRGKPCSCGNRGCLELYAGTQGVAERLRAATGRDLDFTGFCRLAEEERIPAAEEIFSEMMEALACALTSEVNLLNSQAVIIGHEGWMLPEQYLNRLEESINRKKLVQGGSTIRVHKAALGPQAQVKSSACCLLSCVFEGAFTEI